MLDSAEYRVLHFQVELLAVGLYRIAAYLVCYPVQFASPSELTASNDLPYYRLPFVRNQRLNPCQNRLQEQQNQGSRRRSNPLKPKE